MGVGTCLDSAHMEPLTRCPQVRRAGAAMFHEHHALAGDETLPFGRGLYLAWVIPYGIHVESMESIGNSIWNPWNECWLRPQPISCSMDIMDSTWNEDGMVMD